MNLIKPYSKQCLCLLPASISIALGAFTSVSTAVYASDLALEEIVVTAQRREQNLQDVPVSVTAFTGDTMARTGIRSAADYLSLTPNIGFSEDGQAGSRSMGIAIRGVSNLVSGENAFINSVGIYIDEFSVASVPNQVANPQLPDVERIEVLRGPQGTYFGRNSLGGTLNITTKKPTDQFEGELTLGGESYNHAGSQYNISGVINLPINDQLNSRSVLYFEDSSGMVENINPSGEPDSGHKYLAFRQGLEWQVSEATRVNTTLFYTKEKQGTDENVPSGVWDLDTVDTFNLGGPGRTPSADPGTGLYPNNRNKLSHDLQEENNQQSTVMVVNVKHDLNDRTTLTWVSGFVDAELDRVFDNDTVGGADLLRRDNSYQGFSWSSEARIEIADESFDFVAGLMYAQDEQKQFNKVAVGSDFSASFNGVDGFLPPFPEGLGLLLNRKKFEVESIALFGEYTWHATEQWDLTLGGRYTSDTIKNSIASFGAAPGANSCAPNVDIFCFYQGFTNVVRPEVDAKKRFNDFSPKLVVRYHISDDANVYGVISKGYKAGGTSVGNNTNDNNSPFVVGFDAETLWNYEFGMKTELLNNRLRLNASLFHLRWQDLQLEAFRFLTPGDLSSNFEQTINAETARASGAEIEFLAVLTEGLTLSGSVGYLDTEITSNTQAELTGGFLVDLKGSEIPKSPALTANLTAEYRWQIADNEAWMRLELIHRDGQYSDVEGLTWQQTRGKAIPNHPSAIVPSSNGFPFRTPDYNVVNFSAGVELEKFKLNFYVKNLTDEEYFTGTGDNFGLAGIRLKPHPRILGASINYHF